ncbi:hypothetical protein PMAYCL1PPCAC_08423 [Pristionchus mayeri]|uniref:Protein kinase domain-containing protein n=1 Tax=Pristionchus mayeri TaxID=1317129 RepID=A0AAN4ZBQ6_9BILA|nr:hypothetical protein PMAYCL1PPCAC_08423 [Pristionchus mayeri]
MTHADRIAKNYFTTHFCRKLTSITSRKPTHLSIQYEARNLEDSNMYSITRMTEIPEHTMEADMGEARALSTLRHEGIRACYDSWFEKPPYGWQEDADCDLKIKLGVGYICISTLEDWLEANQERGFKHAKLWFKQIISAVAYIHANNVIHRDLQPNKIYLDQHNNLKLCNDDNDQEQHGIYDEIMRENRTNSERGIEMLYAAPEIKPRSRWPPSVYSAKVDVFRLGCIFIEICYAMNKDVRKEVFDAFREGTTHSILDDNPELKEFTSWICTVDSFKRPT